MRRRRALALAAAGSIAVAALAGCSSGAPSGTFSPTASSGAPGEGVFGPHNQADAQFAQSLQVLNDQGIALTDLATAKTENAQVMNAAAQYAAAMRAQNDQAKAWLSAWINPSFSGDPAKIPGLIPDDQFAAVAIATGAQFQTAWANAMATHAAGARQIAQAELISGTNPQAKALATRMNDESVRFEQQFADLAG